MKNWIFLAWMLSLPFTSYAYTHERAPKEQAMSYVIKYSGSQTDEGKEKALNQFDTLIRQYPDDIALRQLYSDLLIVDNRYEKAITQLKIVYQNTGIPSLKLMECMLTERIKLPHNVCYREVISVFEQSDIRDFDYLLALYLSESPDFERYKDRWLETHTLSEEQKKVIALQPRMLVNAYYP
ncbi:hypothetical protein ACXHVK_003574 [Morganella morganii]|uniref:Tetratricopeptide repeat protein n=2 Tax=Morganellaceae TaxID=1903414 RepID=A0A9Q4CKG7_MORMO|nr:hypothetical protein [Morganella morganii]BEP21707.1 hypothetical protein SUGSMm_25040 [Morganella morganii subsp. sibonii]HAE77861.1 hypothetical protein [Morganella sp. (in: enterobacteria)]EGT3624371.1 hypothetical protein [Morganella morganii]EGT3630900.1 hypothetical protein [Morganella morganii]EGT3636099.1 hypothetical protein [Morganella morganii]